MAAPFRRRRRPADTARARHRDLRSDFLLVKSPDTEALVPFRDVLAVDGVPVRDREARLAKLFLAERSADAMEQAEKIGAEGARYNLGNMRSTLGNPVLGLGVLQRTYQPRFHFSLGKEDRAMGAAASGSWSYKETTTPAMIRGEAGRDLFAHGRIWIDAPTGRVLKTELQVEQPAIRAIVTTTFRLEEKSGIGVPRGNARAVLVRQRQPHQRPSRPTAASAASTSARTRTSARQSAPSPTHGPA